MFFIFAPTTIPHLARNKTLIISTTDTFTIFFNLNTQTCVRNVCSCTHQDDLVNLHKKIIYYVFPWHLPSAATTKSCNKETYKKIAFSNDTFTYKLHDDIQLIAIIIYQ